MNLADIKYANISDGQEVNFTSSGKTITKGSVRIFYDSTFLHCAPSQSTCKPRSPTNNQTDYNWQAYGIEDTSSSKNPFPQELRILQRQDMGQVQGVQVKGVPRQYLVILTYQSLISYQMEHPHCQYLSYPYPHAGGPRWSKANSQRGW